MKPERWHRIERLFYKALEMEKSRRTAFLREACAGDRDLQQEMERLLAETPASFLEEPALREIAQEFAATASAAWVGRKVGNYEFMSLVGTGGMGEVYRAHDTQLKREVAIKILPEEFSGDPERIIRLQREAQLLASLNHPNIAAIYDLEETNGFRFLILEFVEGETLEERLNRGPIPLDHALPIAAQITEGLAAAHERGIIHRDLKPANIKLTLEGKVKLLDFGLAKSSSGEAADMNPSKSQAKLPVSTPGMILGTAAYMSPEQANGAVLDRRTDIFTFGAVLYEMLAGQRAFPGETAGAILAAVIRADPDWSKLPADTPSGIRRLLRRCLQKDRNRRLQTAGDARIEIDEAPSEPQLDVHVVPSAPRRRERLAWSALAVVTLIAAVAVVSALRPVPPLHEMRLEITTPPTTNRESLAISPDGQKVVFVATPDGKPQLWLRPLESTARPLQGTDNASFPFWSPDSRSVGFFGDGKLKRIDLDSGLVQALADVSVGRGGTWSPQGVILFSPVASGQLFQVPASGGDFVAPTSLDGPRQARFPHFLPDGRQFLFYMRGPEDTQGIYLASLDSREIKRLTASDTVGAYLAPSWLLFVRQGRLLARHFDLSRGELSGDPVTVAAAVGFDAALNIAAFSVSAMGVVAYMRGDAPRQLTWFDRGGNALATMGDPDENGLVAPALSTDGSQVIVERTLQGNTDLWLLGNARTTRFTTYAGLDRLALWSPDGSQIVFGSNRKGHRDLYQKPSNGSTSEELLVGSPADKAPSSWSLDGRFLLYTNQDPKNGADLWVRPMDGDQKPFAFLSTRFDERAGQFSPDGDWVAYQSNESGQNQIYVRSFREAGRQSQVSTSGGIQARWRRDGKELYYIAPDGKLMAVPIVVRSTVIEQGIPVVLFQTRIWGLGTNAFSRQQYDVAPDGRFLINVTTEDATNTPITLLLNWKPPAK